MSKPDHIEVTVVVSGQPTSIEASARQAVEHLVKEALKDSGNKGQPPSEWELRTSDGTLVDQGLTIGTAGIISGMTLFLSPKAGAGGSH